MAKAIKNEEPKAVQTKRRPALTPEARENQMIAYAINLAEKQLIEGTASSQIITHYLKLGSMKDQLEVEKLRHETELLKAKTELVKSEKRTEELFENAINAMRGYQGNYLGGNNEDL